MLSMYNQIAPRSNGMIKAWSPYIALQFMSLLFTFLWNHPSLKSQYILDLFSLFFTYIGMCILSKCSFTWNDIATVKWFSKSCGSFAKESCSITNCDWRMLISHSRDINDFLYSPFKYGRFESCLMSLIYSIDDKNNCMPLPRGVPFE